VIFKPSEKAPASGELLLTCMHRAGISAGVAQLLVGGPAEGEQLAGHDGIDGVMFTGSTQVGIGINRRLARSPGKVVALQMSGNNPIIWWDTPRASDAAAIIIQSAFAGTGQRCTAARRLIVKSSIFDSAIEELKRLADRIVIGAPNDEPQPFMGPMIDTESADQITESFLYLLTNGGKAIAHMRRPRGDLPFVTPGIIDVTRLKERPDVEMFGPLLQVVRVDDLDEAINEANASRFGLSATLIGGTPQEYNRFWANMRCGMVNWNRATHLTSQSAPFGGSGYSGNRRPGGFYAADNCAYPVTSAELEQPRAGVGVGFRSS
jgi:succinylglutamic semialdehyde dehydrogenase